jgi:RecB family exonuclease
MSSKHKLEHVSASQIKTFKDCPRKWYYQKILGIPTPSTASTDLGSKYILS